jgi:hypothetical protein
MARIRHDRQARGVLYEPFWNWLSAGRPVTQESERSQFSGLEWWLTYMFTNHWHPCCSCGETMFARVMRLLLIAIDQGLVGFSDDERVALDDDNTKALIAALDELEQPPSREWWHQHYNECPARKEMLKQVRTT